MFTDLAFQAGVSLERLASLCDVADAGSIGQAARGDSNRQSLLSRQIAELERVFQTPLLNRKSRPHCLTAEGWDLANAAREFFVLADDLRRRSEKAAKRVVIGAGEALIQWVLIPACSAVNREAAGTVFAFRNLTTSRLSEAVIQGQVDLAIMSQEDVPPSLTHSPPWSYEYAAFVPDQLAPAPQRIGSRDLERLPWAVLEGEGRFRQFLEFQAKRAGYRLNVALECSSYPQIAMAVSSGAYAGFLPQFANTAFSASGELWMRSIEPTLRHRRSLVLAWRESSTKRRVFFDRVIANLTMEVNRRLSAGPA